MDQLPSYPRIWPFGGKIPANPFDGKPAIFQEKIDGSQFSFGHVDGRVLMRSKGAAVAEGDGNKMFTRAVETVLERTVNLPLDVIFRGEYLQKPKHNTLAYGRVPDANIIVFDVFERNEENGLWTWLPPELARWNTAGIGLEYVPTWEATVTHADQILEMLDRESVLGGCQVEGVVMKRYDLCVPQTGDPLFCKYVSEKFKEVHRTDWKNRNPSGKDIFHELADQYRTEARFEKAVQHLRDAGALEESPRDIGALLKEVSRDVLSECEDEIKERLFKKWWKECGSRGITRGLPEWYKERLLREAFADAA